MRALDFVNINFSEFCNEHLNVVHQEANKQYIIYFDVKEENITISYNEEQQITKFVNNKFCEEEYYKVFISECITNYYNALMQASLSEFV